MRTLEEIRNTPVGLLTDDEINHLSPEGQAYARRFQDLRKRETACPGHQPVFIGTPQEERRGWHQMECKHCGKDMSVDSSD
jgi:hypothetical protein